MALLSVVDSRTIISLAHAPSDFAVSRKPVVLDSGFGIAAVAAFGAPAPLVSATRTI